MVAFLTFQSVTTEDVEEALQDGMEHMELIEREDRTVVIDVEKERKSDLDLIRAAACKWGYKAPKAGKIRRRSYACRGGCQVGNN